MKGSKELFFHAKQALSFFFIFLFVNYSMCVPINHHVGRPPQSLRSRTLA